MGWVRGCGTETANELREMPFRMVVRENGPNRAFSLRWMCRPSHGDMPAVWGAQASTPSTVSRMDGLPRAGSERGV